MKGKQNNFSSIVYSLNAVLKDEKDYDENIHNGQDFFEALVFEKELFTVLNSKKGRFDTVGVLAYYYGEDFSSLWGEKKYKESKFHKEMMKDLWKEHRAKMSNAV
jgi:hypothetical protein